MGFTGEVEFKPEVREQVKAGAELWLDDLNGVLVRDGVTHEVARDLILGRSKLNIPTPIAEGVDTSLSGLYGLAVCSGEPKERHLDNLESAARYELFGIDPAIPIRDWRETDWVRRLVSYARYLPEQFTPSFHEFAKASWAAVAACHANSIRRGAMYRASNLPPDYQSWLAMAQRVDGIVREVPALSFFQERGNAVVWNGFLQPFAMTRSAGLLHQNSLLRLIPASGDQPFTVEMLVLPNPAIKNSYPNTEGTPVWLDA